MKVRIRHRRLRFDLYCSQLVIDEAAAGDAEAADHRLQALTGIPLLDIGAEVLRLSELILDRGALPRTAGEDALHISIAALHDIDYLLTWNCTHIANAETRRVIGRLTAAIGIELPTICTPEESPGA
ncbi:MAG: type II toxin-antitoxin system VapC family toxin [Candidatus Riflebacteria bacterium]|nr:type II toxin-antitoxin system VapC family toxin [Candidatus Riflebacteria bacterium]